MSVHATTAPDVGAPSQFRLGLTAATVAITAWGLTGVIIKSIDMDSVAIAFWRFLTYAALLTVWHVARGGRVTLHMMRLALPGGMLLAADVLLFFTAVKLTAIVNATTIGALQPVVIAGFAAKMFGERISRRELIAAAIAITGVIVVVTQSAGTPEWNGWGDLAAVGALCAWSGYFIVAKRVSGSLTPMEFTIGSAWYTGLLALPVGLVFGQDMSPPPSDELLPMAALLLLGGVLGHSMMNWALPRVPLWLSSTLTLATPIVAAIAAWIWLDESLTIWQLVAMAGVVAALTVVVRSQTALTRNSAEAAPVTTDVTPIAGT